MLTFTDRAREMLGSFLDQGDGELEYLRIAMVGSPAAPEFELTLVSPGEQRDDEQKVEVGAITVLIADAQADRLEGATVDFVERVNESGFEVRPRVSGAAADLPTPTGPVADRVIEVLQDQVNPAIASHGGAINLVDVKGTEIYLEMSGGCQGCAMSRLTLRQGVERMLRQAIPELTAVHDITDHASGVNPYFEA
ncbi:NifU family protein [Gaopeijia maritima]|uniref:NifU family protein n=1 Tax=Gaopeijia maritima TaxID=3119007 RepID=A0ABU9EA16_9BACT